MATKKPSKNDRIDLDVAMGLIGNSLLSDGGVKQISGLMSQAKDPTGVMAQLVYHAVSQAHDQLDQKGMKLSNKIWTARAGVVDQSISEVAKLIAGTSGNNDIINPNILEETRKQVIDLLHEQAVNAGGKGDPSRNTGGASDEGPPNPEVNDLPEGSPAEEGAESTEEAQSEGDLQGGVMPPGEAGGSHGPNRMPAPLGLLAGG